MRSWFIKLGEDERLILSPYETLDVENMKAESAELVSSSLLDKEEEDECIYALKKDASRSVAKWIQEKRYIARLLVSALLFVLIYFICSFAIRDPIPMIDEILIAFGVCAVFWVWAMRRDEKAESARAKRDEIFREIDGIEETQHQYVADLEALYDAYSRKSTVEMAEYIASGRVRPFRPYEDYKAEDEEVRAMLFSRISRVRKAEMKIVKQIAEGRISGKKLEEKLIHAESRGLYTPKKIAFLLSLYMK